MVERNIEISATDHSCNQSNLSMKLIFDVYTPRPHFVILQNKEYRKLNSTENEIKEVMQVITKFLIQKPQYDNNTILSFHRGVWYQQHYKHFHAHLCVPKKPYCQEAKHIITSKTCDNYWSSSKDYLNQLNNDMISSKIKYNQYRDRCISMAYVCFNDPVSYAVPLYQFNTLKFSLAFLASSPRIGVMTNDLNNDLTDLYNFMNTVYLSARRKLTSINRLYKNFGAHLCLYVSGKKKKNCHLFERSDRVLYNIINPVKVVRIVGYIQMDEQLYLRWLPAIFHRIWLNEFQESQHLVLT